MNEYTNTDGFFNRTYQIIWYVVGIIETLLLLRFIFGLTGASMASSFVRFIYRLSDPLILPFRGIYPLTSVNRGVFDWVTLVAMLVLALVADGIIYLLQLLRPARRGEIQHIVGNS